MRNHYDTKDGFHVAIIALGSERPVKEFIHLKFGGAGDIYLFDELLPDIERTELHHHLSLHATGANYYRSPGKPRDRSPKNKRSTPLSDRQAIEEFPPATTNLSEDYFYEGHRTVGQVEGNRIVVWCPYKMVIGSTLRWSIDLMNSEDDSRIDRAIRNRFPLDDQNSYAFSFSHQGRTLAVCMKFSGGTGVVDEQRVIDTDAKKVEHHRVWLYDSVRVE